MIFNRLKIGDMETDIAECLDWWELECMAILTPNKGKETTEVVSANNDISVGALIQADYIG